MNAGPRTEHLIETADVGVGVEDRPQRVGALLARQQHGQIRKGHRHLPDRRGTICASRVGSANGAGSATCHRVGACSHGRASSVRQRHEGGQVSGRRTAPMFCCNAGR
jgi:hypothetical protein